MNVLSTALDHPTDVPEAAAPRPARASFSGTWMFNLIAVAMVGTITAFLIFAPFATGNGAPAEDRASTPRTASRPAEPDPVGADAGAPVPAAASEVRAGSPSTTTTPSTTASSATTSSSTPSDGAGSTGGASKSGVGGIVHLNSLKVRPGATPPTTSTRPPTTPAPRPTATSTTVPLTEAPEPTAPPAPSSTTTPPTTVPTTTPTTVPRTTTTTTTTTTVPLAQCEDFLTQPEAQSVFASDPVTYAHFDGDGDGLACEHLPGPPRVPTADEVRQPSVRYYGVHTREAPFWMAEFDEFATTAGKVPNLDMFFLSLGRVYPTEQIDALWERGILPMISFEPIVYCDSDPALVPDYDCSQGQPKLADIIEGRFDDYFAEWATAAAANGKPVVLRFAHEMNGNWYSWSEGTNGNQPGEYVEAWRHVHDLFDSFGADNVVWFWSVNRVDNLRDRTLARYYPGDDYVDWVGMSGYLRDQAVPTTFEATFGATLAELRRAAPGQPIVFGETAAGTTGNRRVEWIENFFAGLLDNPDVWGFVWFNGTKNNSDWRIQYSAAVSAAFAAGVADPRYVPGLPAW